MSLQQSEFPSDCIFEAKLEDATNMNRILHELHHADDHSVLVITKDGLRLITAGEKTFQISAFFASSTFHKFEFTYDRAYINFRFILRDFIECLNLLKDEPIDENEKRPFQVGDDSTRQGETTKTSLEIRYKGRGEPLKLRLENNSNCFINCDLKAFNMAGDAMFSPMSLSDNEEIASIVFDSKKLYEYASGLDFNSSDFVELTMSRHQIPVRFQTKSSCNGDVVLEISQDDQDIIKHGIDVADNCVFGGQYRTQFMKQAIEALKTSTTMKLKCGSTGLLCLEHFHNVRDVVKDNDVSRFKSPTQEEYMTDHEQPQKKRSTVEYFILVESKSSDDVPVID